MNAYEIVLKSREKGRPTAVKYIEKIVDGFIELHGDRRFADDAAVIGGISISGGMGTMLGAALGAVFMEALTNSLTVMKISVYWQNVVFGIVMILSVLLDQYKRSLIQRRSIKSTEMEKTAPAAVRQ